MSTLLSLAPLLQTIALISGLIFFLRQGGPSGAKAVIDIKNEQLAAYEKREQEHRAEMIETRERLTKIEGQLKSKDAELDRLTSIFQNRDPQSTQITEAATSYMKSTFPILLAIAKKLDVTVV